jgi:3-methyladenine DNA glycosylase/8-oxoguanine DNA glycosylase
VDAISPDAAEALAQASRCVSDDMNAFVVKRPRESDEPERGEKKQLVPARDGKAIAAPKGTKPTKPAVHEYVGHGERLTNKSLKVALVHLAKNDPTLAPLIDTAHPERLFAFASSAPAQHPAFILLCEFVVRQRIAVKGANTQLERMKERVGGTWTPDTVLANEADLRAYYASNQNCRKMDTIVDLATCFSSGSPPDVTTMSDREIVEGPLSKIKGIGPVALRTLLVRMGRPDVLVAGDGLVDDWLEKAHGIDKKDTTVAAQRERERFDAAASWAPYRSVGYLLINAAKEGTKPESVLGA